MGERREKKKIDNTRFYKLLGVDKKATSTEIKKAFRKLAMTHHPDKGGDSDKFKEMTVAYEILSDPDKRKIYDQYGEEGIKEGMGQGAGEFGDIFDLLRGGGMGGGLGGFQQKRRNKKSRPLQFQLVVDLEDVYVGNTQKMRVTRHRICKACKGYS